LTENSQTDRFSRGSIVESTHWMVLRRPSEPAAVTGQIDRLAHVGPFLSPKCLRTSKNFVTVFVIDVPVAVQVRKAVGELLDRETKRK
jgi:hypothetical protein